MQLRHLSPRRPVDKQHDRWRQRPSVSPSRKSKFSLSLHPAACLKNQCKGFASSHHEKRFFPLCAASLSQRINTVLFWPRSCQHPTLLICLAPAGSNGPGFAARPHFETSISHPRFLTQAASTLAVITQGVSVFICLPRLATISCSSACGHLNERPVTTSTGPFLGF